MYKELTLTKESMLGILGLLLAILLALALRERFVKLAKPGQARLAPGEIQRLEGALRTGHWEFEQYRDRIVIEQPQALAAAHTTGDLAWELMASVRNDTGRVIKGLEVRGALVDPHRGTMSERVAVVIPAQQSAIEPNEAIKARVMLAGINPEALHGGVGLEVTGVIFD
jgi:hypothetical protein